MQHPSERLWPSPSADIQRVGADSGLRPKVVPSDWRHPWFVEMAWEIDTLSPRGEWRARLTPGFVNARPAFIQMPAEWLSEMVAIEGAKPADFGINPLTGRPYFEAWVFNHGSAAMGTKGVGPGGPIRLTNAPAPFLSMGSWRNPLVSGPPVANAEGELVFPPGPGYPAFFNDLGVRLPNKGGVGLASFNSRVDAAGRDREIRSMDIALVQPKTGTRLVVDLNPSGLITGQSLISYSIATVNEYAVSIEARTVLKALTEYVPPTAPADNGDLGTIFQLYLNNGDTQFDQLKVARVWMVSQPGASQEDQPDQSWEPYVEHSLFWNLNYAQRLASPQQLGADNVNLVVPLLGGVAQPILSSFLSIINTMNVEALAFLQQGDSGGYFWST